MTDRTQPRFFRMVCEEWRVVRREPALWSVLVLFWLMSAYGLANGAVNARRLAEAPPAAAQYNREQIKNTRASFARFEKPGRAATLPQDFVLWHAGIIAYELAPQVALAPSPLAAVSVGQSDLYPSSVLARTRLDALKTAEEIENPLYLLTGPFDLAFVLVYVLPLLILALSYNVLSSEREQGTLPIALAQGAPLSRLILVKLTVRAGLVLASALLLPTLGLLLLLGPGRLFSPGVLLLFVMLLATIIAYSAFWFALAWFIGAHGRDSATNAVTLLGVWLALVLVVPSLAGTAAAALRPTPSRLELVQAVRTATDRAEGQGAELLRRLYREHPDRRPEEAGVVAAIQDTWVQRYAAADAAEKEILPLLEWFEGQRREQRALAGALSLVSPAVLMQGALTELAGTGADRYERFLGRIDRFRDEWGTYFRPRVYRREGVSPGAWKNLPQLDISRDAPSAVVGRTASSIGGLALAALLLSIVGLRALRRYPVAG